MDYRSRKALTELALRLNKLCEQLNEQFEINWGGCCYTAYCIARLLEKDKLPFSLVVFDNEFNLNKIKTLPKVPWSMLHYAITLQVGEHTTRTINRGEFRVSHRCYLKVSSKEILWHYKKHDWNDTYNPAHNQTIKQLIEKTYYDFTNSLR